MSGIAGPWDYCGRDPKSRVPTPITSRPNATEARTVMMLAAELIGLPPIEEVERGPYRAIVTTSA